MQESLSSRRTATPAGPAGQVRHRRITVASLAECRPIRSGPTVWRSSHVTVGRREPRSLAAHAQGEVSPLANDGRALCLSLFKVPPRRHALLSASTPSTSRDTWMSMSMPSRPGTGTLLPSLHTPRRKTLSSSTDQKLKAESSEDDYPDMAASINMSREETPQFAGTLPNPTIQGVGPVCSWGFYDSDEEPRTKPSKFSLGDRCLPILHPCVVCSGEVCTR